MNVVRESESLHQENCDKIVKFANNDQALFIDKKCVFGKTYEKRLETLVSNVDEEFQLGFPKIWRGMYDFYTIKTTPLSSYLLHQV